MLQSRRQVVRSRAAKGHPSLYTDMQAVESSSAEKHCRDTADIHHMLQMTVTLIAKTFWAVLVKELHCRRLLAQGRNLTPAAGKVVQRPLDWPTPAPETIEMLNAPEAHQPHSGAHPLLKMVFVESLVANSSLLPATCLQGTPPAAVNNMRAAS